MADPTVYVDAPRREVRRGGIKSVTGPFHTNERVGAAATIQALSLGCTMPKAIRSQCWGDQTPGTTKTADGVDVLTSPFPNFALYAGVECFIGPDADYAERAQRLLEQGEEREVEKRIATWADADATPGTAVGWTNALALAEQAADAEYPGQPVILVSREGATHLGADRAVEFDHEGNLRTVNGSLVIASGALSGALNNKVFVIGFPSVYVTSVTTTVARDLTTNVEMAIAERSYGVLIDCGYRNEITVTEEAP